MNVNIENIDDELYRQYKEILNQKGIKITVNNKVIFEEAVKKYIEQRGKQNEELSQEVPGSQS